MKRISPNDLEAAQFPKTLKGYDTQAVDAMLKAAAGEISTLQGELKDLRKEYQSDFRELEQFREKQWKLADALVLAQQAADEIRAAAKQEANLAVQQGRQDAERIKGEARNELVEVEQTIKARREEKENFEARFRRLLDECLASFPDAPPLPDALSLLDVPPFPPDGQDVA